jgi:hypothetical protein
MFIDENINDIIKKVINTTFKNMNITDKTLLENLLIKLILFISVVFNFEENKREIYLHQLCQNNYQDIKWLLSHLLPYINDTCNYDEIESISDIYTKEKNNTNSDINTTSPKYKFSNLQYNRCVRTKNNYKILQYEKKFTMHNFYLLLKSIQTMSNKMLVNWIDIVPFNLIDYKNHLLFINTKNKFDKETFGNKINYMNYTDLDHQKWYDENNKKLNILQVEDIYNTLSIDLFDNIVHIKWLIFDIPYDVPNNVEIPLCIFLLSLFNENQTSLLKNIKWENINEKYIFSNKWYDLINLKTKNILIGNKTLKFDNDTIQNILIYIFINFNRDYNNRKSLYTISNDKFEIYKNVKKININDDEEDIIFTKIEFNDIKNLIKNINAEQFYIFMTTQLEQFKNTWYGTKLLNENKTQICNIIDNDLLYFYYNYDNKNNRDKYISYKNIYNYAKSFLHYENNKVFTKYSDYWASLTDNDISKILEKLNDKTNNINTKEWFNIKGNIRRIKKFNNINVFRFVANADIDNENKKIYANIKSCLIEIIFEVLITKGVLTYFNPDKTISDKLLCNRDKINVKAKELFFRQDKSNKIWTHSYHYYTGIPYANMKKFNVGKGDETIFDYNSRDPWYKAYALDWIAQIGFCHHYINNQVIFITGATGVGKSTQIPNLFAYYSKAIDYKNNAKTVCSQPRIGPTKNNASYVSQCIGVPIFYKINNKEIISDNYYIQMKHSGDNNEKNINGTVLKYTTDGSLLNIVNTATLKNGNKNIYDIVMIDESHEHGNNIDLILTLIKTCLTYNNQIKLVILSATMDDDEPLYRRYYRNINDNLHYPLSNYIKINQYDRINVDRRYHISPPSSSTRYNINEFYEPKSDILNIVDKILKTSTYGEVLIFQPGVGDIMKLLKILNDFLPSNIIALPLYADLPDEKKDFIQNITDLSRKKLKMNKSDNYADANIFEGSNSYSRIFIVATNIAEASITIETLKFVIETGNQKVNVYDYEKKNSMLITTNITESSRLQRKGRVGRKSEGTVYYLYPKGTMENNVLQYPFAISDVTFMLCNILKKQNEDIFLINDENPHNIININNIINLITKITNNNDNNENKYYDILLKQYCINGEFYNYYGNENHYDYYNYEKPQEYYQTGLKYDDIIDEECKLYLIHPDELNIKRNINGDVVDIYNNNNKEVGLELKNIDNYNYKKKIKSYKMITFMEILSIYGYIITDDKQEKKNNIHCKSSLYEYFGMFDNDNIISNHNLVRTYLYGLIIDIDLLNLIAFYKTVDFDISKLFEKNNKLTNISNKYIKSDNFVKKILDDLDILLEKNNTDINNEKILTIIKQWCDMKKLNFDTITNYLKIVSRYKKKFIVPEYIINKLNAYIDKQLLNFDPNLKDIVKEKELQKKIKEWCENNNCDYNIINTYLKTNGILKKNKKKTINYFRVSYDKLLSLIGKHDKIDICFFMGFPYNVVRKIDKTKYYVSCSSLCYNNIYKIANLNNSNKNTLINDIYLSQYILYLKLDNNTDEIKCLIYLDKHNLRAFKKLYNIDNIQFYNNKNNNSKKYIETLKNKSEITTEIYTKIISSIKNIDNTIKYIYIDFSKYL